jgi:hypothetical protein
MCKPVGPHMLPIEIECEVLARLRPEAARRGTTVPRLIRDLLDHIAERRRVRSWAIDLSGDR